MTKLKQIAVVVGEGELWLHPLLSSTGTMFKKDLPRFVLGLGKVSITKCQHNGVVVGLGRSEVGLVSDLLGWNRSGGLTTMVKVKVIRMIVVATITRLSIKGAATAMGNIKGAATVMGNIKGAATAMGNIKGAATSKGNTGGSVVSDRCQQDILAPDWRPWHTPVTGTRPRNILAC